MALRWLFWAMAAKVGLRTQAIDNGLGLTPPRGWRSWNSYPCEDSSNTTFTGGDIISDSAMRTAMHAVLDKSRAVNGTPTALADLGYSWVSMDDGWQQCNCSTHQDMDPTLPSCSIGDCRGGRCSFHSPVDGTPMVNPYRFPTGMKSLVDYGHSLGLKVGTYLNNCICMEGGKNKQHYEQDVAWMMAAGFDEVKIDNCGSSHNVSYYAELFNKSGKPIRIEDCHTSPTHPIIHIDEVRCPMNMYRSGGDISASFGSIIGEIYATITWNDRSEPLSFPGCWAYPDMMQVGNFGGAEPTRSHEERAHFSLWCINSAPLVLGYNLGDTNKTDRVWNTITNLDALAINAAWAGSPGSLVKAYPAVGLPVQMASQTDCGTAAKGWQLSNGTIIAPSSSGDGPDAPLLCLLGNQHFGKANGAISCPPATTKGGLSQCGNALFNCSEVAGSWKLDAASGALKWAAKPSDPKPLCLAAIPGHAATDRKGNMPGGTQPVSSTIELVQCPVAPKLLPNTSTFSLHDGLLKVGTGACITPISPPGVQLWSKPLGQGKVGILVINVLDIPQHLDLPLADIPGLGCIPGAPAGCVARDVWSEKDITVTADHLDLNLEIHESAMYIFGK